VEGDEFLSALCAAVMRSGAWGQRLASQFGSWASIVGDPVSARLERVPSPGKWNGREHLAHITRMHGVCSARIRVILARESPTLPAYRAEKDPTWAQWRQIPVPELLETAARRRETLVETVQELSDAELDRIGVHTRLGPMPMSEWLEFFLLHESHHLYEIFKLARTA